MSDAYAVNERLDFIGLDAKARDTLRSLRPFIEAEIQPALSVFYERVRETPTTRSFFRDEAQIAVAQAGQGRHWATIVGGQFDDAYVAGVRRIGETPARIGLDT